MPNLEAITPLLSTLPAALAVVVGAFLLNFVSRRGLELLATKTSLTAGDLAPFGKIASWIIVVATVVLLLGVFGFDLGGVWTMLATVGALVAIGFIAVWSVLSNLSCTLFILVMRPFSVGDEIEFVGEPVKGRVTDLNFVFTTLRTDDGGTLQVPNNMFFQKVLKRRRGDASISLAQQLSRRGAADV